MGVIRYYAGGSVIVDPTAEDHAAQQPRVDRYWALFWPIRARLIDCGYVDIVADVEARKQAIAAIGDEGLRIDALPAPKITTPYAPKPARFAIPRHAAGPTSIGDAMNRLVDALKQ